jgi:hypothetical protein
MIRPPQHIAPFKSRRAYYVTCTVYVGYPGVFSVSDSLLAR